MKAEQFVNKLNLISETIPNMLNIQFNIIPNQPTDTVNTEHYRLWFFGKLPPVGEVLVINLIKAGFTKAEVYHKNFRSFYVLNVNDIESKTDADCQKIFTDYQASCDTFLQARNQKISELRKAISPINSSIEIHVFVCEVLEPEIVIATNNSKALKALKGISKDFGLEIYSYSYAGSDNHPTGYRFNIVNKENVTEAFINALNAFIQAPLCSEDKIEWNNNCNLTFAHASSPAVQTNALETSVDTQFKLQR